MVCSSISTALTCRHPNSLYKNIKIMKRLSNWASQHVWQTWLILIILHTILIDGAWFVGTFLYLEGIVFEERIVDVFIVLSIAGLFVYPFIRRRRIYWQRKAADLYLVAVGSLALMMVCNQFTHETIHHPPVNEYAHTIVLKSSKKKAKLTHKLQQKAKKIQQRMVKRVKRLQAKNPDIETVGFIILFVLLALLLSYGVIVLSCDLSCSGYEVAAVMVGTFGGIGIIAGLTIGIIWAVRRGRRLKAEAAAETSGE